MLLSTKDLSVGYHNKPLIKDINVTLQKGEIITLIGPNGAGKSTILKTIAKQLEIINGDITLEQDSIRDLSSKDVAKHLAIVFTQKVAPELMKVKEVVALGRYPYTGGLGVLSEEDHQIVDESMKLVQINEIAENEFTNLSDGQKQRALLARAICQQPDILILDEPTSFLDIKYKLEFLSILQRLTRENRIGVLMSLHELDLAQRISHKIICIQGHEIKKYGTVEEVFSKDYIKNLYEIEHGSFIEKSGCVELEANVGSSKAFVIAGNETGTFVFRNLQKQGIVFSTGILSENDLDYPVAKALSNKVISAKAYENFSMENYEQAKKEMLTCDYIICCQTEFKDQNKLNKRLLDEGEKAGMEVRFPKDI